MANKREDAAAAKAKKQKIVLVVGGVLLVGLAAIQGPKLLKGSSTQPQEAPTAASADTVAPTTVIATTPTPTPSGGSAVVVSGAGPRATAVLAGVTIRGGAAPAADASQLIRFSLFEVKDPFIPQASDEVAGSTASTGATTTSPPTTTPTPASSASPAQAAKPKASVAKKPAAPQLPTTNATILLNGKANFVELKDKFPTAKPLFVVTSLNPTVARIGVAGGEFKRSKTIALTKGKKMTLVNDETGARYVLKLVYTGSAPEQTASFTKAEK